MTQPIDTERPWWCETCESWRHTAPCGRDECPRPSDPVLKGDATPPATPEPPEPEIMDAEPWRQCLRMAEGLVERDPATARAYIRKAIEYLSQPPAASGGVERLIAHLRDRFALLTDCTPLDEKAATVLHARIDELQNALAGAGDRPTPGGTK